LALVAIEAFLFVSALA